MTFAFTVKFESEEEAMEMQHTVASFLGVDITKVDRLNAVVYCARMGMVTMKSVMTSTKVPRWKVFWMIVKPGRKQWIDNLSSKEAKKTVTDEEKRKVIDEMMRRLDEAGLHTEITSEEEIVQ